MLLLISKRRDKFGGKLLVELTTVDLGIMRDNPTLNLLAIVPGVSLLDKVEMFSIEL